MKKEIIKIRKEIKDLKKRLEVIEIVLKDDYGKFGLFSIIQDQIRILSKRITLLGR